MRSIVTIIVLGFLGFLGCFPFVFSHLIKGNEWVALILWIITGAFFMLFVISSIRVIPADPPHKAVLTFLGKRQKIILNEGWNWVPLYGILFKYILVKVVKINYDLTEQIVRTPDYAELGVKISITFTPGAKNDPQAFIEYLNSGGENGVKEIIEDVIRDRLRAWAFSKDEGPANWQEAIGSRDEAIAVLLKAILGDDLEPINSNIPTPILLKYFSGKKPLPSEKEQWGEQWGKLENELNKFSQEEREELQKQVEERRKAIQQVRQGNGYFVKKSLGITINRFTINEIYLLGKAAEAVEKAVQEKYETEADETEIKNVLRRIKDLQKELNISVEQALEIVQTERNKVIKSIHEGKLNVSPETRSMFQDILRQLFSKNPSTFSSDEKK